MSEESDRNLAAYILYQKIYAECSDAEQAEVKAFIIRANEKQKEWES